jgi:hypothetical protein
MDSMETDVIRGFLAHAHGGHYLVRIRAVNPAGNTVDVVGYVTEVREDGGIRVSADDAERGHIHEFAPRDILGVERVHGTA